MSNVFMALPPVKKQGRVLTVLSIDGDGIRGIIPATIDPSAPRDPAPSIFAVHHSVGSCPSRIYMRPVDMIILVWLQEKDGPGR